MTRRTGVLLGLLLLLLLAADRPFTAVDFRIQDWWVRWRLASRIPEAHPWLAKARGLFPPDPKLTEMVFVLYDDRAYLGIPEPPPPWNRRTWAKAFDLIASGAHRLLGIDLFFAQASVYDKGQDDDLVRAVGAATNTVLMGFRRQNQTMALPFPALARSALVAPPYFYPHVDECVRKASLVFRPFEGNPIPSFPTEMARLYWGIQRRDIEYRDDEIVFHLPDGDYRVPLYEGENLFINYDTLMNSIPTISLFDIYHGKVDPRIFKDKIVVAGISNSLMEDRFLTPTGIPEYGTVIHAMTLQNLLTRSFLRPAHPWQGFALAVAVVLVSFLLLGPRVGPMAQGLLTLGAGIGFLVVSFVGLIHLQQMVSIVAGLVALAASFSLTMGLRFYDELQDKLRIRNAFQHYVTASVVNEILKDPTKLNLHGEERVLSIFFSDIAGFTSLSEGMPPIKVVELLNEYLTEMTDIIFHYEGLLDKYEGDAIMAVFGAPIGQTDHAIRSCLCALKNQSALATLREKWRAEGKPDLRVRIGINTGVVVVGNMGSKMRFDYTVIGDNVNLAARLESANKLFESEILVSEATARLVESEILTRYMGKLQVVGRQAVVPVFEVLCWLEDMDRGLIDRKREAKQALEDALGLTVARRYVEALQVLTAHLARQPEDRPAAVLKNRVEGFRIHPPPPDWDGTWKQEGK